MPNCHGSAASSITQQPQQWIFFVTTIFLLCFFLFVTTRCCFILSYFVTILVNWNLWTKISYFAIGSHSHRPQKTRRLQGQRRARHPFSTRRPLVAGSYRPRFSRRHNPRSLSTGPRSNSQGSRRDVIDISRSQFLTKIFESKFPSPYSGRFFHCVNSCFHGRPVYESCWKHFQDWLSSHDSHHLRRLHPPLLAGAQVLPVFKPEDYFSI